MSILCKEILLECSSYGHERLEKNEDKSWRSHDWTIAFCSNWIFIIISDRMTIKSLILLSG